MQLKLFCRVADQKGKDLRNEHFPLIRRLISSFLIIISIMVVFVVVMMLKMECNKSDLWAYTNPAGKTSLEKGQFSNPKSLAGEA